MKILLSTAPLLPPQHIQSNSMKEKKKQGICKNMNQELLHVLCLVQSYFGVWFLKPEDKWRLFSFFDHFSSQIRSVSQTLKCDVFNQSLNRILPKKEVVYFIQIIFPSCTWKLSVTKFDFLNLRKHSWKTFCPSQKFVYSSTTFCTLPGHANWDEDVIQVFEPKLTQYMNYLTSHVTCHMQTNIDDALRFLSKTPDTS